MKGVIVKSTGSWYKVLAEDNNTYDCRLRGKFKIEGSRATNPVAVGDKVILSLEEDGKTGIIRELPDRKNHIIRKSTNLSKKSQVIAANLDQAVLIATLYVPRTSTALWMSGSDYEKMLWWDSKPGIAPEETGQFVLVKSTDDGLTWSDPINITEQIKDPEWQLLLAGPGMGITLDEGTLIFAGQFKEDIGAQAFDGGQYSSHSTIVYSKDGGETWQIGTGAKPNTTEAQVVELADGGLMLNMRDDLNRRVKDETNGRAVSVTYDMGETWVTHPTSNSALPEPNCMASLIGHNMQVDGQMQQVLFFSNPNDKHSRVNMTIKASLDDGNTWPEMNQVLLNETPGFGYSCMTMVDDNTVGILYEGVKELFFQKIQVSEILRDY